MFTFNTERYAGQWFDLIRPGDINIDSPEFEKLFGNNHHKCRVMHNLIRYAAKANMWQSFDWQSYVMFCVDNNGLYDSVDMQILEAFVLNRYLYCRNESFSFCQDILIFLQPCINKDSLSKAA
jgi:hypothetical protein